MTHIGDWLISKRKKGKYSINLMNNYFQPSVSDITGGRIDLKFLAPGSTGLYYILITKKVSSDNARGNTNELLMVSILHKSSKNKGKSSTINNATYIIGIASFCSIILD